MHNMRRKLLSQNFLANQALVRRLVSTSSIAQNDLVVEIGPGKGIITRELVKKAQHVIAVELDFYWYQYLQKTGLERENVTLHHGDFLAYTLPKTPYKIFANLPFSIEADIFYKLINASNPPQDCYVVVMKEFANRFVTHERESMLSVLYKPWFDFSILHYFSPKDFSPVPDVNAVLFRFTAKKKPLVTQEEKKKYQSFVKKAFGNGEPVYKNLQHTFPVQKVAQEFHRLSIHRKTKPSQLTLNQWIALYNSFFSQ